MNANNSLLRGKRKKRSIRLYNILFKNNFIYFCLCWVFFAAWAFSSCGKQGLFVVMHGLLTAVSCCGAQALGHVTSVFAAPGL